MCDKETTSVIPTDYIALSCECPGRDHRPGCPLEAYLEYKYDICAKVKMSHYIVDQEADVIISGFNRGLPADEVVKLIQEMRERRSNEPTTE